MYFLLKMEMLHCYLSLPEGIHPFWQSHSNVLEHQKWARSDEFRVFPGVARVGIDWDIDGNGLGDGGAAYQKCWENLGNTFS